MNMKELIEEYRTSMSEEVLRLWAEDVVACMRELEQQNRELSARVMRLRKSILDTISFIPSGKNKAILRDAYD